MRNPGLYAARVLMVFWSLVLGPAFIAYGVYCNHRDGASLKWPKTSGKIIQYDNTYQGGRNSHYRFTATYTYIVNGRHYTQQRFSVWSEYVAGETDFRLDHPVSSPVDVYYDPQDAENAVLAPGPDQWVNRNLICMGVALIIWAIVLIIVK